MTKKINMLTEYRQEKIVDKNEMFTIEIPAWYLKDIMKFISDQHWKELQKGGMYYDPELQQQKYRETKISSRWKWLYNFILKQIKEYEK